MRLAVPSKISCRSHLLPTLSQDVGLVPIVEPDVSMSGTHTLEAAVAINTKIQSVLYRNMLEHGVFMEGCILKSNIVNPGRKCPVPYTVDEIAQVNGGVEDGLIPAGEGGGEG